MNNVYEICVRLKSKLALTIVKIEAPTRHTAKNRARDMFGDDFLCTVWCFEVEE